MKFLSALNVKALSALLALVSVTIADSSNSEQDAIASPDSAVVALTSETFSKFLSENPLVLAEFFAPWCGHCKALGPQYSKAADDLVDKNIKLAQIDCVNEAELCQSQGIRGYPTLKVFKGSETDPSDYEGPRSADGIVSYMIKQSLPAVSIIDDVELLETFIEDQKTGSPVVVEIGTKSNQTFYDVSEAQRDDFSFVQTQSKEFVKKYGDNKILIFTGEASEPTVYSGKDSLEDLTSWLKVEVFPYFGELDGSTYQKYASSEIPLAYLFYNTPEEREAWAKKITPLSKESRGDINFVGIDGAKFGRHAENLNIEQDFPAFVIHNGVTNKKYAFPQEKDLNAKDLAKFIKEFKAGKIEPIVKTEDVPEVQENSVYKIVGKTHDKVINDETKDVLVKYYAPWCGHCKKLAPTYEELAELYSLDKDSKSKVLVANVDATLNDVDVDISGYPTLILYPAGDKSNPIVHKGGRDLQSLISFIKENGTFKVDANDLELSSEEKEDEEKASGHDEL